MPPFLIRVPSCRTLVSQNNKKNNELVEWDARTFARRGARPLDSEARALAASPDSRLVAVLTFEGVAVHDVGAHVRGGGGGGGGGGGDGDQGASSALPQTFGRRDDPVQVCAVACRAAVPCAVRLDGGVFTEVGRLTLKG